jgi:hypothetical protein
LKVEWCGSSLIQDEKYQKKEKPDMRRNNNNNNNDSNNANDAHTKHNIQLNIYQWSRSFKNRVVFRQYIPGLG